MLRDASLQCMTGTAKMQHRIEGAKGLGSTLAVSTSLSFLGYVLIEKCAHSEAIVYGSRMTYAQERRAERFAAIRRYHCKEPNCA